ncbi:MAG: tetratricopeptide repeat protein [Bacteroidales bacterium]|jgi:tetratricopeptide (TPR) repeat protein|nr:tetratricopeptide repeat protein [Bacteroidales bacterium]
MKHSIILIFLLIVSGLSAQVDTSAISTKQKASALYIDALKFKLLEDYEKARPLYEELVELDNTNTQAHFDLGNIYMQAGLYDEAVKQFNTVVLQDPDNQYYMESVLDACVSLKLYSFQISLLRRLIELKPQNADYYYKLADVYRQTDELSKSITVLEDLSKYNPKDVGLVLKIASLYEVSGNPRKAASVLETFSSNKESNPNVDAKLIDLYLKSGNEKSARRLADKNMDKMYALSWSIPFSFAEFYILKNRMADAEKFILQGLQNQSLDQSTKISVYQIFADKLTEAGHDATSPIQSIITKDMLSQFPTDSRIALNYSEILYKQGLYEDILPVLETALQVDSLNYRVLDRYMWALTMAAKDDKLLDVADKVLKIYPMSAIPYYHKGAAYFRKKDYNKAIDSYQKALNTLGNFPELEFVIHSIMGEIFWEQKRKEEAFESFNKALEIKPDDVHVLNNYAYWLAIDNRRLEDARKMSLKTIIYEPKNATFLDTYAWVLYKLQLYSEALDYQKKAMNYSVKPSGVMIEHLGDIYFKLGKAQKALEQWKKASSMEESSEFLKIKIETGELHE